MTGESKTRAIKVALQERKQRLALRIVPRDRGQALRRFLETEVWPQVPRKALGRRVTRRERAKIPSQGLLVPLTIDLGPGQDPEEAALFLRELGFDARNGGPSTVLVDGIPGTLSRWGGGDFLRDFFASPEAARAGAAKLHDSLAKSYACKGAVKFGQRLHGEEIERLLDALSTTEVPRFCPHGRPLYLELSRPTIDARFERT